MKIETPKHSDIPALRALWQEAFGDEDTFLDLFFGTAFDGERARCVRVGDKLCAALYWFDCSCEGKSLAYIYAVATAKAYRGRGLGLALMDDTHRLLLSAGYAGAVLVPVGASLYGFYERLGYTLCSRVSELTADAAQEEAALYPITPKEYARRRRALLPKGGVIQEKENLTFLAAQASFYAGDGLLLAARREGDTLVGIELLGNSESAPAIVQALGCTRGRFRTVGQDKGFAMYRPLADDDGHAPTYFGLAFD